VILRAGRMDGRVVIEVEDECGGLPQGKSDLFTPFGERRAKNRTGLGLGLSIARRAVRAQDGDIEVRNSPGKGCTFIIQVPAATADVPIAAVDPTS
jgi:signal transduction histidine kinase